MDKLIENKNNNSPEYFNIKLNSLYPPSPKSDEDSLEVIDINNKDSPKQTKIRVNPYSTNIKSINANNKEVTNSPKNDFKRKENKTKNNADNNNKQNKVNNTNGNKKSNLKASPKKENNTDREVPVNPLTSRNMDNLNQTNQTNRHNNDISNASTIINHAHQVKLDQFVNSSPKNNKYDNANNLNNIAITTNNINQDKENNYTHNNYINNNNINNKNTEDKQNTIKYNKLDLKSIKIDQELKLKEQKIALKLQDLENRQSRQSRNNNNNNNLECKDRDSQLVYNKNISRRKNRSISQHSPKSSHSLHSIHIDLTNKLENIVDTKDLNEQELTEFKYEFTGHSPRDINNNILDSNSIKNFYKKYMTNKNPSLNHYSKNNIELQDRYISFKNIDESKYIKHLQDDIVKVSIKSPRELLLSPKNDKYIKKVAGVNYLGSPDLLIKNLPKYTNLKHNGNKDFHIFPSNKLGQFDIKL